MVENKVKFYLKRIITTKTSYMYMNYIFVPISQYTDGSKK